ncbi:MULTISPECIES: alpha-keto acid decarboxylase family protein [Serratia]|uniref:Alpha-keto acid decarboxylase family protein n=1 Tax=Serratia fonticola TaxID=47917 RepID=A0AAW3WL78_SERFO|nr:MULTISPECIES: thiamine pyrophosphate-binding protein [Serratia]MBC3211775.1 alpha-keto acid decarboxylase family protein [Serratia fonticola]NYA12758.1 alpha-keto acid decarboxylase family protein [Serratia fonticola]NYA32337.1 alpha-keto acid decarboxylase family protein [Serratia fonticola]RDL26707.1 indolepyruvate decarboxylase [Serratia fonticola]UAN52618.1 alpha-keto acid decarboxylase family protein [Serratia sp. JSRIV002]
MRITIGSFILQQLRALKVDRIYGVPGDYNLALLETIEHDQECEFIGNCNELNAAYAADGYARLKGAGALITTYGVGDLAALSGIAGAYAESAPVICIAGTPPLHAMQGNALLHHSLADGNFDNVMNCFRQFTVAQALITPENAATEIPRVIACAWQRKKPVYLQLPSDICEVEIEVADNPAPYRLPSSDASHLQLASAALLARISRAKRPIILIDQMVERYHLQTQVLALADKFAIPLTNMPTAKCAISENTPGWQGGYNGDLSRPELFELMAESDCILSFGVRLVDSTTGYFSQQIPEQSVVDIQPFSLKLDNLSYPAVTASELLQALLEKVPATSLPPLKPLSRPQQKLAQPSSEPLDQDYFWQRIQRFIQADDVLVVENGTSGAAIGGMRMPNGVTVVNQPIWGSIGYTLPALLGTMMAAPQRRQLLFIGDGSFQLTAQELSTLLRHQQKPIVFLINNDGYTIERYILGETSSYNDIGSWDYARLPAVLSPQTQAFCVAVATSQQLEMALEQASRQDQLAFIEVKLPRMDSPPAMKEFCRRCNSFNFGLHNPRRIG